MSTDDRLDELEDKVSALIGVLGGLDGWLRHGVDTLFTGFYADLARWSAEGIPDNLDDAMHVLAQTPEGADESIDADDYLMNGLVDVLQRVRRVRPLVYRRILKAVEGS